MNCHSIISDHINYFLNYCLFYFNSLFFHSFFPYVYFTHSITIFAIHVYILVTCGYIKFEITLSHNLFLSHNINRYYKHDNTSKEEYLKYFF